MPNNKREFGELKKLLAGAVAAFQADTETSGEFADQAENIVSDLENVGTETAPDYILDMSHADSGIANKNFPQLKTEYLNATATLLVALSDAQFESIKSTLAPKVLSKLEKVPSNNSTLSTALSNRVKPDQQAAARNTRHISQEARDEAVQLGRNLADARRTQRINNGVRSHQR